MLRDPRLKDGFKKRLQESAGDGDPRPDIAGFSRDIQELHKINTTLTFLLRAITRNQSIPLPPLPLYPAEEFKLQELADELADLDADIEVAMTKSERKETR